jgi:glycerol-3-phosphate acyltransferase PlsX
MATSPTTRIALDAMGADRGPRVLIRGAIEAVHERPDIHVYLVGREKLIARMMTRMLKPYGSASHPRLQIIHAADVAGMAEKASSAVKRKDTSVNVAAQMVSEGKADALVSVGNTGAAKAAALFIMGRLKNVKRPALAALFPTADKPTMLMDVGATTDCKPEYLYQFAVMGNAYMKNVMGRPNPRIGVLSIGEEEGKGTELVTKTFDMLRASHMNFIGNAEGRDVMKGTFDVIVCDGFVGNSMLKMTEGTAYLMYTSLAAELKANRSRRCWPTCSSRRSTASARSSIGLSSAALRCWASTAPALWATARPITKRSRTPSAPPRKSPATASTNTSSPN